MAEVALNAVLRRAQGSSDSRRLRASGKIPGVIYGHGIDPTPVALEARDVRLALNTEAGLNALIQLNVEGTKHLALPRDVQRHPVRNTVAHVDFQIVGRNEVMHVEVPLNFVGEADGVTKQGGLVEHLVQALAVSATPSNIPAHIDVDISNLQIDESIRVKDIELPKGVTTQVDDEEPLVVGKQSRVAAQLDEVEAAAATEEGGGETAEAPADES